MIKGGWSWENNYSPRNACATMNNEFSGMTSLYSIIKTCTASKYKNNNYHESVFNLFNNQNYNTFSVHDYTDAYYPRKTIHPNMGSGEYYGVNKLGISYSSEYVNWANDDEAMKSFLKILDKKTNNGEHFMSWFTTVSSHQPYGVDSKQGNAYYDMTKGTKYPSDVRRFMSKLKFVDDALGILMDGLEERGMLEDTVIVLYGDHYPYGISTNNLNKVLDYDTKKDKNAEQVPFVIYNAGTTDGTVFKEYTSYMNILPTLANLFNLDYDPRLYLGYDLFSEDAVSMTVFADGSWKNEIGFYDASKNKVKYYGDKKYTQEEVTAINKDISAKMAISEKAIESNYFKYLNTQLNKIKAEQLNLKCADFSCENPLVAVTTTKKKETTTTTKKKVTTKGNTTTTTSSSKPVVNTNTTSTSTTTTTTTTTTVAPKPETDEGEEN
jgi:phosphoglycerol transferase MdoB-like AlkP superfamily enzyme